MSQFVIFVEYFNFELIGVLLKGKLSVHKCSSTAYCSFLIIHLEIPSSRISYQIKHTYHLQVIICTNNTRKKSCWVWHRYEQKLQDLI